MGELHMFSVYSFFDLRVLMVDCVVPSMVGGRFDGTRSGNGFENFAKSAWQAENYRFV